MATAVSGFERYRWLGPAATAGVAAVGAAYVGQGHGLLPCPLHATTGLWCPGCGLTRAVGQLWRGDVLAALGANVLVPFVIMFVGAAWLEWTASSLGRRRPRLVERLPAGAWWTLGAVALLFAVARNTPTSVGRALAP
jgi:hypothetical protein